MIKHSVTLKKFEDNLAIKDGILPFEKAMQIFASLWTEAYNLGIFPLKEPLEGIETDIKIAKILNSCSSNYYQK